jgi:hypothetical protein
MVIRITPRQGLKVTRATEAHRKATERYFTAIVRAVPELARYPGYHDDVQLTWETSTVVVGPTKHNEVKK